MRLNCKRRGFTLIEVLIVMAIILVLSVAGVVSMGKQLMSGHETAVIQEINTLHQAEVQYYSQYGQFASSLGELGPPTSGAAGPQAAGLIPEDLGEGQASGYVWSLASTSTGYAISAVPEQFGKTGSRTFYSDETRTIRNNFSAEPANASSPAIGAPIKIAKK